MDEAWFFEIVAWVRAQPPLLQALVVIVPPAAVVLLILSVLGFPPMWWEMFIPWRLRLALSFWRWWKPETMPGELRNLRLDPREVRPERTPAWAERAHDAVDEAVRRRRGSR